MHDFFDDCGVCGDNGGDYCSNCGTRKTWQAQGGGAEIIKCPNAHPDKSSLVELRLRNLA